MPTTRSPAGVSTTTGRLLRLRERSKLSRPAGHIRVGSVPITPSPTGVGSSTGRLTRLREQSEPFSPVGCVSVVAYRQRRHLLGPPRPRGRARRNVRSYGWQRGDGHSCQGRTGPDRDRPWLGRCVRGEHADVPLHQHRTARFRGGHLHGVVLPRRLERLRAVNILDLLHHRRSAAQRRAAGPCFLDFAQLTGIGAYVTVSRTGSGTVRSNWLK